MTEREKLIELLAYFHLWNGIEEKIADYLIKNGVKLPVTCGECEHYCLRDAADGKYCEIFRYESPIESGWCCYGERRAE